MRPLSISGYYAILDVPDRRRAAALAAHACALQVRMKSAPVARVREVCHWAGPIARSAGALLVVNDHVELALEGGADAVHIGQDDMPLGEARRLAPGLPIGVSTHNLDQVRAALDGGADYLGFGPVFATQSKENPDPVVGLDGLAAACSLAAPTPVVAIGGITLETAPMARTAGAAAVCVLSAVNAARDPAATARALAASVR